MTSRQQTYLTKRKTLRTFSRVFRYHRSDDIVNHTGDHRYDCPDHHQRVVGCGNSRCRHPQYVGAISIVSTIISALEEKCGDEAADEPDSMEFFSGKNFAELRMYGIVSHLIAWHARLRDIDKKDKLIMNVSILLSGLALSSLKRRPNLVSFSTLLVRLLRDGSRLVNLCMRSRW